MALATGILIVVLILYAFKIGGYRHSWIRYPKFIPAPENSQISVSIVVAFRNESNTIQRLLDDLASQHYPVRLFEVILVDDHSDDGSEIIVKRFCEGHHNFITIPGDGRGKKSALLTGIRHSANRFIVTTDADCELGPQWLNCICDFKRQMQPDLIIGIVDLIPSRNWFFSYQQAEFRAIIASGAAAAIQGKPVYCNGANMAFDKSWVENNRNSLKPGTVSGDDTFLLHHIKDGGGKISLLNSPESLVRTSPCKSFFSYIEQRVRWASKARKYTDKDSIYLSLLVFTANLSVLISLVMLFAGRMPWLYPILLGIKFIVDFTLLSSFLPLLKGKVQPGKFLLFSVIYPVITVFVAITGLFGKFTWKGRKYGS